MDSSDTDNSTFTTLSDELKNNIIEFVDGFGTVRGTFDFVDKNPYFYGNLTQDMEVKLINKSNKSKYNRMLNIIKDYYFGDYNVCNRNNIMGKLYKISLQNHLFGEKYNHILLIIDNPFYDPESDNISMSGRYKLVIYSICHSGVYFKYLREISSYTSTI
jgi:hypothetical protein